MTATVATSESKLVEGGKELAPILLIHGLFGSLSDPVILGAFGNRPVWAPDLIGYGTNRENAPPNWTLEDQADHVAAFLYERALAPIHVVGHSVGGAIAIILAARYPALVRSVTNAEGNFTLRDAFWSQKISTQDLAEIEAEVAEYRQNVPVWIGRSGVRATAWAVATAEKWLDNQPASTLQNQARAVFAATQSPKYLDSVCSLLDSGLRLHLLAGARARATWGVPSWVVERAASFVDIPSAGHLMMLNDPIAFAEAIVARL